MGVFYMRNKIMIILGVLLLLFTSAFAIISIKNNDNEIHKDEYAFEYKFKPIYSDIISPEIAAAYIDSVIKSKQIYETCLNDFEVVGIEQNISDITWATYFKFEPEKVLMNEEENELLELILAQADNASLINMIKLYYKSDEINKSMGIKQEYTEEEHQMQFEEVKKRVEKSLKDAEKYID